MLTATLYVMIDVHFRQFRSSLGCHYVCPCWRGTQLDKNRAKGGSEPGTSSMRHVKMFNAVRKVKNPLGKKFTVAASPYSQFMSWVRFCCNCNTRRDATVFLTLDDRVYRRKVEKGKAAPFIQHLDQSIAR